MTLKDCSSIPKMQYLYVIAVVFPKILEKKFINISNMNKAEVNQLKNDIKSFKSVRRVVKELIINFPDNAQEIYQQEEFLQISNAHIFLDKTINRLEKLLSKS